MKRLTVLLLLVLAPAASAAPADKFDLAGGCFTVGDSGPLRFKAATLGKYLLYTTDERFMTPAGPMAEVDGNAVWTAEDDLSGLTGAGGAFLPGPIAEAAGCPEFPEADLNATGRPARGAAPHADVEGMIDQHAHLMAFDFLGGNFHCGRPWSPLGVTVALPDCEAERGPGGSAAPVQNFLDFGQPAASYDTVGWPTFADWPTHKTLTFEQTYFRWIERAYLGGLRLVQTNMVENEALCRLVPAHTTDCNDMSAVRRQTAALFGLQDYIDAQAGGPGEGWFRIVVNPYQARRVINQGKMAVVMGVELSRIFGCGVVEDTPQCTRQQVDDGIAGIKQAGIRVFYPVHKFDNAFGGTKMDGGEFGVLVNMANRAETGQFWAVETCPGTAEDREQITTAPAPVTELLAGPLVALGDPHAVPVYGPAPHCNTQGLTELGEYLLRRMVDEKFLIELDHMSAKTADETLDVIEEEKYSGVMASHSWSSAREDNPRIRALGGVVAPAADATAGFVADWELDRTHRDPRYRYGIGTGWDTNGLSSHSGPRGGDNPVRYPFRSHDGRVTFERQTTGVKTWDINADGVAHYGMMPDWLEDLSLVGGPRIMRDLFNSAETYIEMWERAEGVPGLRRVRGGVRRSGVGRVRLGQGWKRVLMRAGQPQSRPGKSFRWRGTRRSKVRAAFRRGRVALVGRRGVKVDRPRDTRRIGRGLRVRRAGGRTFVYRGRRAVAVTRARGGRRVARLMRSGGL